MNTLAQTAAASPPAEQACGLKQKSSDLGHDITLMQAELERAVLLAGMRHDPTRPLIEALSASLGLQWRLHDEGVKYLRDVSERLDRQLADTIAQAEKALESKRAAVIESLVPILSDLTVKNAKTWRRTLTIKTALTLGAFAVVLALGVGMAGYGAGWESGRAFAVKASGELAAALHDAGPAAEVALSSMTRANNLTEAWARCQKLAAIDKNGRRVCAMPMWVDPEGPPANGS